MDSGDMPKVADHAVGLPQRQPITGRPAGGASLDHLVGAREQGRRKIDRQRLCGIKIRTYLKIARGKRAVRSRGSCGRSIPNGRGCGAAIESKQRSAPRANVAYSGLAVADLAWRLASVAAMRRDHLDAVLAQLLVEWIAVVGAIADQILRLGLDHVEVEA